MSGLIWYSYKITKHSIFPRTGPVATGVVTFRTSPATGCSHVLSRPVEIVEVSVVLEAAHTLVECALARVFALSCKIIVDERKGHQKDI